MPEMPSKGSAKSVLIKFCILSAVVASTEATEMPLNIGTSGATFSPRGCVAAEILVDATAVEELDEDMEAGRA